MKQHNSFCPLPRANCVPSPRQPPLFPHPCPTKWQTRNFHIPSVSSEPALVISRRRCVASRNFDRAVGAIYFVYAHVGRCCRVHAGWPLARTGPMMVGPSPGDGGSAIVNTGLERSRKRAGERGTTRARRSVTDESKRFVLVSRSIAVARRYRNKRLPRVGEARGDVRAVSAGSPAAVRTPPRRSGRAAATRRVLTLN